MIRIREPMGLSVDERAWAVKAKYRKSIALLVPFRVPSMSAEPMGLERNPVA